MAPQRVLVVTALLSTISLASAYDSNYGNSLYARSYDDDLSDSNLYSRSIQKVLARRGLIEEEYDDTILHIRSQPYGPSYLRARVAESLATHPDGCSCNKHMAIRDADADPIGDALFEHDDNLFNYKRGADGEGSFFDDLEFFDLVTRDLDSRDADAEAEAEAEADPVGDALFEHDDMLFNYRRSIDAREAEAEAEADADPVGDALFEHDDILFSYRRSLNPDPFDETEFTDLVARSINGREADAYADPVGDALLEHDDILFNYRRRSINPFEDIEFTDLVSRANTGYIPWFESATAQARKEEYKSPGALKAEERAKNGAVGNFAAAGGQGGGFGGMSDGSMAVVGGGLGGHAFNEAVDAGSAGASSMDAAALDAGGIGI